jgi:hypothetical protein
MSFMRSWLYRWFPFVFLVVALLFTLFLLQQAVNPPLYTWQPQASKTSDEIGPDVVVGQSFVGEYDGLSAIDVKLSVDPLVNNQGQLSFHLRRSSNGKDLVVRRVAVADIEENAYYRFDFSKVYRSSGESFYFYLKSQDESTVKIWGSMRDLYETGQAQLSEMSGESIQDLTFRAVYDPALVGKIKWLVNQLQEGKPLVWGDGKLYVLIFMLYGIFLYLVLMWLMRLSVFSDRR